MAQAKPIVFGLADIQKPQTEVAVTIASEPAAPAAPVSFSINDIVPERVASVGGEDVRFAGAMSDADIQQASQDVYGQSAVITDGPMDLLRKFWTEVNPVALMKGMSSLVTNEGGSALEAAIPILGMAKKLKGAGPVQGELAQKAADAASSGDLVTATRHLINYLIPLVGPGLDEAGDMAQRGEVYGAAGKSLGIGVANVGPYALAKVQPVAKVPAPVRNPNPATRDAVAFAQREGIPATPATATGNPVLLGLEKLADHTSLTGSVVGQRATQAHDAALAATSERMAARAHPSVVTAEQAGQAVRDTVRVARDAFATQADEAYAALRKFESEAEPANVTTMVEGRIGGSSIPVPQTTQVRLAVDVGAKKDALRPAYEALERSRATYPNLFSGAQKRAHNALADLLNGPDMAPLSVVDEALGHLKDLARVRDGALRSKEQGAFAFIVQKIDDAVRQAAMRGGPKVIKALEDGRKATKAKYAADEIYEAIRTEPVKAFTQTTAPGDSAIAQLREIAKLAPSELPKIGRAYLDELFAKATAEGGFAKSQTLHTAWSKLGPETKKLLFQDLKYIKDLDDFFLYAKRASMNPNTSGTAYVAGIIASMYRFTDPLSGAAYEIGMGSLAKLLHSPASTRALVNGLRIPMGNKTGAAAAAANLMKLAEEAQVPMAAVASREPGTLPRQER